ncbi:MAG: leucyl aminopeptidase [Cellulosilyticaceae bacterium]|uniref:leucyl aminopeptidase n=1 Tax=Niameybacter sp. TaxID=2033640 RepID=UPI002FC89965
MNIIIKDIEHEVLQGMIIPVYEDQTHIIEQVELIKKGDVFSGKEGECLYYTTPEMKYMILVGLGKYEALKLEGLKNTIAKGAKKAKELKLKTYGVSVMDAAHICTGGICKAMVQALKLSIYSFDKYKAGEENKAYDPTVYLLNVPVEKVDKLEKRLEITNHIIEGVIEARNLVNEPANVIYPESLAERVQVLGTENGFEVEIFDETQIQDLGMKAFYEVGKGSARLPRLIVMRYMGDPTNETILGLVGKGLTFDTGGYSLKPAASMDTMKSDMAGAAAVIGTMCAVAKNKLKSNVVAVVAACENAISGISYKPGDIIGSMAGKTIEVLNTDAEGRLTLIDAVTYIIRKEKATSVVDVATLTGAALVALGTTTTAVISNDDAFYNELMEGAAKTGEKFWRLPAYDDYKKLIKSEIADLKNLGGRNAGTITAGLFIGEFVEDKPWLHLDIAGTSWAESSLNEYSGKGATGVPVTTLYNMIEKKKPCHH